MVLCRTVNPLGVCVNGNRTLVVNQHCGAGGACHNGIGLFLGVLRLALELGDGRGVVVGLGVRPLGAGHTLLCHSITSPLGCHGQRQKYDTKFEVRHEIIAARRPFPYCG